MYFDIETGVIDDVDRYLVPAKTPANYKSADAIAKHEAESLVTAKEKAALDPGTLRIAAIGYAVDDGPVMSLLCQTEAVEQAALRVFWGLVDSQWQAADYIVGYNVLAFDMPALITRSFLLGVEPSTRELKRYGMRGVIDLMDRLSFSGLVPARSQAWWCQRFGIDIADPVKGSDIPALVASGNWATIQAHVEADIDKTRALATRIL